MHWQIFVAGMLVGLALCALLIPQLPRLSWAQRSVSSPARGAIGAAVLGAFAVALTVTHGRAPAATGATAGVAAGSFAAAARVMDQATTAPAPAAPGGAAGAAPAAAANAGSMDSAIANLEARLARGGGTPDDWELLAKSFEFLGRPADAAKARAHQLPPADAGKAPATAAGGVTGTVTLDPALAARARSGETLFIIAKSVDSPGPPLAVFRGSVGTWPLSFTLDDSQSMLPGRTLSGAHKVTIEARISSQGQPLPASGDLQGSSGVVDPSAGKPVSIRIDKVLP